MCVRYCDFSAIRIVIVGIYYIVVIVVVVFMFGNSWGLQLISRRTDFFV